MESENGQRGVSGFGQGSHYDGAWSPGRLSLRSTRRARKPGTWRKPWRSTRRARGGRGAEPTRNELGVNCGGRQEKRAPDCATCQSRNFGCAGQCEWKNWLNMGSGLCAPRDFNAGRCLKRQDCTATPGGREEGADVTRATRTPSFEECRHLCFTYPASDCRWFQWSNGGNFRRVCWILKNCPNPVENHPQSMAAFRDCGSTRPEGRPPGGQPGGK